MLQGKLREGIVVVEFRTNILSDLDKTENDQKEALKKTIEKAFSKTDGFISHSGGVWNYKIKTIELRGD
jgi:hypothetical protein